MLKSTHTLAQLELSPASVGEIRRRLGEAGQLAERTTDAGLDLSGIAVVEKQDGRPFDCLVYRLRGYAEPAGELPDDVRDLLKDAADALERLAQVVAKSRGRHLVLYHPINWPDATVARFVEELRASSGLPVVPIAQPAQVVAYEGEPGAGLPEGKQDPSPEAARKRFRPLLDRVVVRRDDAPSLTAGGLHIPDVVRGKKNAQRGVVVAVGPGLVRPADEKLAAACHRAWERFNQLGVSDADAVLIGDALADAEAALRNPRPIPLKPGDVVYMAEWTGTEIEVDGEKLLLVREDDLIAVEDAS